MCIEEQFYLLLPAVVLLAVRFFKSIRLAWALLALLIFAGIATRSMLWLQYGRIADGAINGYYPNIYYSSFCRFDEFLPGVAITMLKNFHRSSWERLLHRGQATLALGAAGVSSLGYLLLHSYEIEGVGYGFFMTAFGYSLIAVCFAILTVSALSPGSLLYRTRVPGVAHLAAWSYAIYLTHKPLAVILAKLLGSAGIDAGSGTAVLLIIGASLLGGWLLYRLVEEPFMQLRDRIFPTSFPTKTVLPPLSVAQT